MEPTNDPASLIRTDDVLLDQLGSGYTPKPEDERLTQYAAAYRDAERRDAFAFFAAQRSRTPALREHAIVAMLISAVALFLMGLAVWTTLGASGWSMAIIAAASALSLTATIVGTFVPVK